MFSNPTNFELWFCKSCFLVGVPYILSRVLNRWSRPGSHQDAWQQRHHGDHESDPWTKRTAFRHCIWVCDFEMFWDIEIGQGYCLAMFGMFENVLFLQKKHGDLPLFAVEFWVPNLWPWYSPPSNIHQCKAALEFSLLRKIVGDVTSKVNEQFDNLGSSQQGGRTKEDAAYDLGFLWKEHIYIYS